MGSKMQQQRRFKLSSYAAALLAALVLSLTGCGNFFVYPGSLNGTTSSGDYVFVSNSTTGTTYLNGYSVSNGTLAASSGSPISTGVIPTSMAITQNDNILYVGSTGGTGINGIIGYSIGAAGALTSLSSGTALAGGYPISMDISPDDQWLFALDSVNNTISEYGINLNTGALTLMNQITFAASAGATLTPSQIRVAPTGNYVVATVGTAGDIVVPLTTSSGAFGSAYGIATGNVNTIADFSVAIDGNNYAYIGRTTGVAVYQLGATTATIVTGSPYTTGSGPKSLALSSTYSYLYSGNQTDTSAVAAGGSISEFSQSSGALTSLGIPIAAPVEVYSMGRDNSGKYILAAGYNSSSAGLILYTIGSNGGLTQTSSATTAAPINNALGQPTYPAVMALTH
jgi:6-phosphogluconolactonase